MRQKNTLLLTLCLFFCIAIFCSTSAIAGGYSTNLYSTSGLGNSYAGSATGVHDVSDIFFNPSLTAGSENSQFVASMSHLRINVDADNVSGTNSGGSISGKEIKDAGADATIPAIYLTSPIDKKTSLNLAITSPFGLATKYDSNWVGRYRGIESSITTANVNPSISRKINEDLAVGFGVQIQYTKMLLTKAIFTGGADGFGKTSGEDVGYGYNFGGSYKINEYTKFGIGYKSKIDYKIKGITTIQGLGSPLSNSYEFDAKTTTPESVTTGLAFNPTKRVELVSDVTWTRWSRLQNLTVKNHNTPNSSIAEDRTTFNWHDSFLYSIGGNFVLNSKSLVRTGAAYEKDATATSTREPRLPTGDRVWLSFGFSHKFKENLTLDASYIHQFFRAAKVDLSDANGTLSAKYKTKSDIFSLAVRKDF